MATTPLGDIPDARFYITPITHASVASNGADARIQALGPFDFNIKIKNVYWSPTGAAQNTAAGTASYRRLSLYNGGTAGTVTATASRLGSANLNASIASHGSTSFTLAATPTVASGGIIYLSHETVGGAETDSTPLRAGFFSLAYEIV